MLPLRLSSKATRKNLNKISRDRQKNSISAYPLLRCVLMNYYINFPTKENMNVFHEASAEFEASLILGYIKSLNISEASKKQVLDGVLNHLKANPR